MIGQNNAMQNYTVFKSNVTRNSGVNELPPNFHLRKTRSTRSIEIPQGFEPIDSYQAYEEDANVNRSREEDSILKLFKRLNDKIFNQQDASQISRESTQVHEYKVKYESEAPKQPQNYSTEARGQLLHPVFQNSWWNAVDVADEVKAPQKREMTQKLQQWCQAEYEQTRVLDNTFYTPQELRDRIDVFKEINNQIAAVESNIKKVNDQPASEPWELTKPLPINPKAIGTYEAMDNEADDDEESYRNQYYSSTFERVA